MRLTFNRRQALGLGASAVLLGAIGLPAAAQAARELRIGWQKGGVLALLKGSGALEAALADQGIKVSWAEFTSGPPLLEALSANALDFGYTGDVPPLFAHAARGNLVFVGATQGPVINHAILVPTDSPIQSLADLKGKRVAYKRGSSAQNFTLKALRTAGLTLDDITALDLSPPDAAAAFENGALDAWSIWDPYFALVENKPNVRVLATTEGILQSFGFYSANGDFAKKNGALITQLIELIAETGRAGQQDLEGTIAGFAAATGLPPEVLRTALTRKGADLGRQGFIEEKHIAYEQELADEFHALGIIPRKLDIRAVVWTPPSAS